MITTTPDLGAACDELSRHEFITVDTEFLRETTFWPKLCVIQMAGPETAYVIDALAEDIDLSPFFALMRDERVLKVFHAARQDIEIIWHRGGFVPSPIFDTQVAAMVCGYGDSISYDQLVGRITGAQIDKTHRFTDWSRRPLSEAQIEYAVADVTHLRDVYASLKKSLDKRQRTDWVSEEMKVLTSESTYRSDPEDAWRRLKMRVRKSQELLIMQAVAAWREREAQSRDVPRSRVIKDDAIYEISTQAPKDAQALGRLRTVPNGFERSRAGGEIVAVVQEALTTPKDEWPQIPRGRPSPEGAGAAVDLMKVLLKLVADNEGVAAKVIATVDDLEQIAANDDADVEALKGWRRELFGDLALKLKHGELGLSFDGKKVVTIERGE
ncbi:ribonuclease D [Hartmannibacter diazotrophicus]|nr:ribonuclease D [Hartmannibacter diazotrophicus]